MIINYFKILFILISINVLGQNQQLKRFTTNVDFIEIEANDLDDIEIRTSKNNDFSIFLSNDNSIPIEVVTVTERQVLKVSFKKATASEISNEPFRKYITKRLERARVIVEIPKNKKVAIYGKTIGVNSNSYQGKLGVYIDKGNIRLGELQQSVVVKLFLGNVFAALSKDYSLNLKTTNGKISLDSLDYKSEYKKETSSLKKLEVNSIHANIILKQL